MCVLDCDILSVNFHNYDFVHVNSDDEAIVSIVIQDYPRLVISYGDWHEEALVQNVATKEDAVLSNILQKAVRRT